MGTVELLPSYQMTLYEETIREWLDRRTLVVNADIDENIIEDYVLHILKWNLEDKHVPVDEREPIKVYINSPGGDLIEAMYLCDVIATSKTPVITVGFGIVASAAFHIFITGHKRIAFQNTVLLMHDGQMYVQNSGAKVKDTMKFYDSMDDRVKKHVLNHTKFTEEYYDSHYNQELYLYADKAKELGVVDEIVGADVDIASIF